MTLDELIATEDSPVETQPDRTTDKRQPMENNANNANDTEHLSQPKKKSKRQLSEKQLEALQRSRDKRVKEAAEKKKNEFATFLHEHRSLITEWTRETVGSSTSKGDSKPLHVEQDNKGEREPKREVRAEDIQGSVQPSNTLDKESNADTSRVNHNNASIDREQSGSSKDTQGTAQSQHREKHVNMVDKEVRRDVVQERNTDRSSHAIQRVTSTMPVRGGGLSDTRSTRSNGSINGSGSGGGRVSTIKPDRYSNFLSSVFKR